MATETYIVRLIDSRELVGIYTLPVGSPVTSLILMIDECCDPTWCEYSLVEWASVSWPGEAPYVVGEEVEDADDSSDPEVEVGTMRFSSEWMRFCKGWVYYIQSGDFIKIGYSSNVEARMSSLQTGSPFPLTLRLKHPGDPSDEADAHRQFAAYRANGEWFRLEGDLLQFIEMRSAA